MSIRGIIPAIITPMHSDETVNFTELVRQVERLISAGIHGIFPFGTNGEGYILSASEKEAVLRTVIEATNKRVPVYAGTGCIGTKDTVEQSVQAQKLGADILSIITPSFAKASQNELYAHYKSVAESVDLPIVLYNIPARTGNALTPETVGRLSQITNIKGVKDSSGNFDTILQYIEQTREVKDFAVLSGNDSLILWTLLAGGAGGVTGCANVYPKTMVSVYELFQAGNMPEARVAQDSIRSLRKTFQYGNPNTMVKTAVSLLGHSVGTCRAPFNQVSDQGIAALKQVLQDNAQKGME